MSGDHAIAEEWREARCVAASEKVRITPGSSQNGVKSSRAPSHLLDSRVGDQGHVSKKKSQESNLQTVAQADGSALGSRLHACVGVATQALGLWPVKLRNELAISTVMRPFSHFSFSSSALSAMRLRVSIWQNADDDNGLVGNLTTLTHTQSSHMSRQEEEERRLKKSP